MAKIDKSESNIFPIPKGATIDKRNYVYVNTNSYTARAKGDNHTYSKHDKKCIGVSIDGKTMYANNAYLKMNHPEKLPVLPEKADSVSVGLHVVLKKLAEDCGLADNLCDAFSEDAANIILDLASYMLSNENAVFQHYPIWARRNALFSGVVRSDSYLSQFLSNEITISKINRFKELWAKDHIGSGRVYLCYDSTNTNCQSGVALVEKGHAKDNQDLEQVNTDYVVRQEDGLPVTFKEFPGSINDMSEAEEMISFLSRISGLKEEKIKIMLVCDRGYISEDNVAMLDNAGIGFLLMLKSNTKIVQELMKDYGAQVKANFHNMIPGTSEYGMTVEGTLFKTDTKRWFHLLWDGVRDAVDRTNLNNQLEKKHKELDKAIDHNTKFTSQELAVKFSWFKLKTEPAGTIKAKSRGRGKKGEEAQDALIITGYEDDDEKINLVLNTCGVRILVSSEEMSAEEAAKAYTKRDCVEKVFRALKSSLGMDRIGMHSDEGIRSKAMVWFVASILRSMLFLSTAEIREKDKKSGTVTAITNQLEAICADKDLNTNKYERRYQLTNKQKQIFAACDIKTDDLNEVISSL